MSETEVSPAGRRAAIKGVAQNREAALRRVDADLVCATGYRFGLNQPVRPGPEPRFRDFRAGMDRAARISFPHPHQGAGDGDTLRRTEAVGEQEIGFADAAGSELFGERAIGDGSFAKHQHAAGFLVEPVQDGQRGPAGLAMP